MDPLYGAGNNEGTQALGEHLATLTGRSAAVESGRKKTQSCCRAVSVDGRAHEWEIDVDGVVVDDGPFRVPVFDEVDEVECPGSVLDDAFDPAVGTADVRRTRRVR